MSHEPIAKVEMLIRRPAAEVFAAFVEPDQIDKFWLFKSSGRIEPGAKLRWDFIIRGATTEVTVKEVRPNERIVIEWDEGETVEWSFAARTPEQTFLTITHSGIGGSPSEAVAKAVDSTAGFSLVVCELKALLEHGISLNLGPDKFPDAELAR